MRDFYHEYRHSSWTTQSSNLAKVFTNGNLYPLSKFLSYDQLSPTQAFTTSISLEIELTTFLQAFKDPKWRDAYAGKI